MSVQAFTRCLAAPLAGVLAGLCSGVARADDLPQRAPEAFQVTRVDVDNVAMPSPPGYRTDLTELAFQRWASRGRAEVGVGVGSITLTDRANSTWAGRSADAAAQTVGSGSLLMLGLRYRTTAQSSVYADATRVSGLVQDGEDRVVGKVGIEFKAVQSNWKIAYGGLGFRLAGDARMTLKLRRSGLAIMMRSSF